MKAIIAEYFDTSLPGNRIILRLTLSFLSISFSIYYRHFLSSWFVKIISLCEDKDIQVRIVKIPLPGKEKYTQEYMEGFHSYYKAIKKSFPGITVDWFSAYEEDKFVDSSYMNSHGALKFSKELKMLYSEDF